MSTAHHLELTPEHLEGNDGLGRYVLLPGSVGRVHRIAGRLTDATVRTNRRGLDAALGTLVVGERRVDVAAVPTGMGCPSVDIVANELLQLGARRLLRVGTSGSLQASVKLGDLVVATAAVRDEGTSDVYAPREVPASADPVWVQALMLAARELGLTKRVHVGLVHTKDSFFGREFGQGPDSDRNRAYMEQLTRCGVLASEMEAAHLFVLGTVFGGGEHRLDRLATHHARLRCGAVLAAIGDLESGIASLEEEEAAEERLIDLALGSVGVLSGWESFRA
ncbi:MAG: uridine phosphorylase [Myxococcota bacterium]